MKFAIIVSEKDKAAMNIKSALTGTYFKPTKEFFEDSPEVTGAVLFPLILSELFYYCKYTLLKERVKQ